MSANPETPDAPQRVTIAVLTFRRAQALAALLPLLVDQARDCTTDTRRVRVLVVDNDPDGSAAAVVASAREAAASGGEPIDVRHVVEQAPGISAGRNRALTESADSDLLAFIDDDETPEPRWLHHLLDTHARYDCAAVAGPVLSVFTTDPTAFVAEGGFFRDRTGTTGEARDEVGAGNLLLDLDRLRRHGLSFDRRYGLTGGEDTKFCRDLIRAGERIVWSQEAVCLEPVAPERATEDWVRRRTARLGAGWARVRLDETAPGRGHAARRAGLAARGAAKAVRGAAQAAVARVRRDEAARGRAVRESQGGVGILSAALGVDVVEYGRPPALAGPPAGDGAAGAAGAAGAVRPVTVAIPTFRRPEGLRTALAAALPQAAELAAAGRPVQVVVVDNSPEASARTVVAGAAPAAGGPGLLRYVHEPSPGLAAVRSTALAEADADGYLAFMDDDTSPQEGWLRNLVAAGERTGAAAVIGSVDFRLPDGTAAWVRDSGHFDAAQREEDAEVFEGGSSANLLLDLRQVRRAGVAFDPGYAFTGGEDTRLLRDLRLAGGRTVAAPSARVTEPVPADRATRSWVLARAERNAESWARVRVDLRPGEAARLPASVAARLALRGGLVAGRAGARWAAARLRGDVAGRTRAEYEAAEGRGIVRGALGINRAEYARPQG